MKLRHFFCRLLGHAFEEWDYWYYWDYWDSYNYRLRTCKHCGHTECLGPGGWTEAL
jgi:hypothetical protein